MAVVVRGLSCSCALVVCSLFAILLWLFGGCLSAALVVRWWSCGCLVAVGWLSGCLEDVLWLSGGCFVLGFRGCPEIVLVVVLWLLGLFSGFVVGLVVVLVGLVAAWWLFGG